MATVTEETGVARYVVVEGSFPREIVLLRGDGCKWRRCAFCDYHRDFSPDQRKNDALNARVLACVTGRFGVLEVINSGSFCDLGGGTVAEIVRVCRERGISLLSFECHWMHRELIAPFKARLAAAGLEARIKMGVETFDEAFREDVLHKGMPGATPADIARYADDVCLLQGLPGQTVGGMTDDVEIALAYFDRVCINVMTENAAPLQPAAGVIAAFRTAVYPRYAGHPRVEILLDNTDWGLAQKVAAGAVSK